MFVNFSYKKAVLIAWLTFALNLVVVQYADSKGRAVIHQVLRESKEDGSSIIIKLSGNPRYKVIGIEKREILIALKDTELSKGLSNKQIAGDGLIQHIEINKKPHNVSCLLVKLRKPYIRIDHQIETGKGRLWIRITDKTGVSTGTSTTASFNKASKPGVSDSPLLPTEMEAPVALSRSGGIDELLNPGTKDATPDTDLFLRAVEHFQEGRWDDAIQIFRKIMKAYPGSPHLERAYFLLAKSYDHKFKKNISDHFMEVIIHYREAVSKFPNSVFVPDAMVSMGNCYFKAKNYYEALAHYNLVYKNYKTHAVAPEALFQRGKILALTKKPQEAIKSFEQLESRYPETPFARTAKVERAKALFDMNAFKRSLRLLDEVITVEPDKVYEDPDILLYFGYNYYELGRLKEARDLLCKTLNCYPDIESNHLVLTRIADTYREEGMEAKALKLYNMVLRRYPDSEGGLISLLRLSVNSEGVASEKQLLAGPVEEITYNRPTDETYKEIMKSHGDHPLSQLAGLRLAHEQLKHKDYEGSIQTLRGILSKHPDTPLSEDIKSALRTSMEAIFKREQQAGNYENILNYYEQMKDLLSIEDAPNLLLILGDTYRRLHLYDRAISMFEKAKSLYTDQDQPGTLLFGLGESFYKVKRFEEAQQPLEVFVARYPEDKRSARAYFFIGDMMLRQKKYDKAMAAFNLARQKTTEKDIKIRILMGMAEALSGGGDYDKASSVLNKAIALLSQNKRDSLIDIYDAYQRLGETYLKLGDNEQAASAFEMALKVSPKGRNDHRLQFRLAECYQKLQARDKAERILNQIIVAGDPFWSRMAEAKINEIHIEKTVEGLGHT